MSALKKSLLAETEFTFTVDVYSNINRNKEKDNSLTSHEPVFTHVHSGTRLGETTSKIFHRPKTHHHKSSRKQRLSTTTQQQTSQKHKSSTNRKLESDSTSTENENQSSSGIKQKQLNSAPKERQAQMLNYLRQLAIKKIYNSTD